MLFLYDLRYVLYVIFCLCPVQAYILNNEGVAQTVRRYVEPTELNRNSRKMDSELQWKQQYLNRLYTDNRRKYKSNNNGIGHRFAKALILR